MSRFGVVKITKEQETQILCLKSLYERIEKLIDKIEMSPREKALALTKLEESAMWATKAISIYEINSEYPDKMCLSSTYGKMCDCKRNSTHKPKV